MTLITFQDGKPVLRDGKVGTESACCCGGGATCCVIDGVGDATKTTKAQCDEAGGTWVCDGCCCFPDGQIGAPITGAECDAAGGTWVLGPCTQPQLCYDIVPQDEEGNCPAGYTQGNNGNPNFPEASCVKLLGAYHDIANAIAAGCSDIVAFNCNLDPVAVLGAQWLDENPFP